MGALLIGVSGQLWGLGLAFAAIVFGVATVTTSAHTWIGANVADGARGRVMGLYETTWAVALLVGAPLAGLLIAAWSWWTPFALVGVLGVGTTVLAARHVPGRARAGEHGEARVPFRMALRSFGLPAWSVFVTSQLLTLGAVMSFSTYGAWLKDRHGFSTASVAALTFALGPSS